jgi:redox-sensitive bicupin YhaK (pirin superfamily)
MTTIDPALAPRRILQRTSGHSHGPITRLMSPSDLGQVLKPFVFLDIFNAHGAMVHAMGNMPLHPHSGVATVTLFTEGRVRYHDPVAGSGTIGFGGVEWMRAGSGVWHGKEMSPDNVPSIQGFQLWLSLPADLENSEPVSRYIEAQDMVQSDHSYVIVGNYQGKQSPVPAPEGVNYLLVTLTAGERWTYHPPAGHTVGWLALAKGKLDAGVPVDAGELVIFEPGEAPITLAASDNDDAVFVLGSAVPHPHPLYLGNYSVHTSGSALEAGEQRIEELARKLKEAGDRRTSSGTIPVFR